MIAARLPLIGLLLALAAGVALKLIYSGAADDEPRWLLSASVTVFENVSGLVFAFEPGVGYLSADGRLLVYRGCSGLNAFVLALWQVALVPLLGLIELTGPQPERSAKLPEFPGPPALLLYFAIGCVAAFLITLMANAARMQSLLILEPVVPGILHPGVPHMVVGSFVYLVFLIVFFLSLRLSFQYIERQEAA